MGHVADTHQGTLLVQGKSTYTFTLADGRKVKGADLVQGRRLALASEPPCAGLSLCPAAGQECDLWRGHPASSWTSPVRIASTCSVWPQQIPATRLLRVWSRRHLIEQVFRTLKHLLATDACQVHSEDAYYGHLVLRLMASFVLYYTSSPTRPGCTPP